MKSDVENTTVLNFDLIWGSVCVFVQSQMAGKDGKTMSGNDIQHGLYLKYNKNI